MCEIENQENSCGTTHFYQRINHRATFVQHNFFENRCAVRHFNATGQRMIKKALMFSIKLNLPDWVSELEKEKTIFSTQEERMGLAIELARRNVKENTGGPFGAAIF